jgi:MFS family permease
MNLDDPHVPPAPPISWRKIGLLAILYFVQGLPFGFFVGTYLPYLRTAGYALGEITLASIVNLPWVVKFLWAPLVDRYYVARWGRRRSWILPSQAGLAVLLVITAALLPQLGLMGLMLMLTAVNLCAATQDIAVDGLAVDLLDDHERGHGNSVQAAAYKVGMIGGGAGLAWLLPRYGIEGCLFAMAAGVAVGMIAPLLLREPPPPAAVSAATARGERLPVLRLLGEMFQRPAFWAFLGFMLLVKAGDSIANPLFRLCLLDVGERFEAAGGPWLLHPFLMLESGISWDQINLVMNIGGMVATLLGSAVGGFVIGRFGRTATLWVAVIGQGVAHLAWAVLASTEVNLGALWAVALSEHLVSGLLTVVVFTIMMDAVRPEAGGSQYTLLMSLHIGMSFGVGLVAGTVAQNLGYTVAFGAAGVATLACIVLLGTLGRNGYLSGKRPAMG